MRGTGAESCPTRAGLENAVRAHLGYDPFDASAPRAVFVRLFRRGDGLVGQLEVRDEHGIVSGTRELASPHRDCDELVSSLSIAIAISIDPLSLSRLQRVSSPSASSVVPAVPAPPPAPVLAPTPRVERVEVFVPSPRRPADVVRFRASAGLLGSYGSTPSVDIGFALQAGVEWRRVSIGIEGRADLPTAAAAGGGGEVAASLFMASIVPCAKAGMLFGCALGSVGVLQGAGEGVSHGQRDTTVYGGVGGRAGIEFPFSAAFSLRVHGDILATLTRTTLQLNGRDAWTTPPVGSSFGLAGVASF